MAKNSIVKNVRNKKSEEVSRKGEILKKFSEAGEDFLLPAIKEKSEEVSKYIEKYVENDTGLTSTQILPLIAKRSMYDIVTAGHISYTPQELACAFNFYIEMIENINKKVKFPPSKQSFCLFIGISTPTYNNYLQDPEKCEIMRIIDDYISANVLNSSQMGELKEISSIFYLKSQQNWVEAQAPVVIEHKKERDVDSMLAHIQSIKKKTIDAEYEEFKK